jgi:hypothetical protein
MLPIILLFVTRLALPSSLTHFHINGMSYRIYDSNDKFEKKSSAQNETHSLKLKNEIKSKANTMQQQTTKSIHSKQSILIHRTGNLSK